MDAIINTLIFCYSMFAIILTSVAIGPILLVYLKAKRKRYAYFAGLLCLFLCDLIFLHYTDFFYNLAPILIPETFLSLPLYKALSFAMILYLHLAIVFDAFQKKIHKKYLAFIALFVVFELVCAYLPESNLTIWLFYGSREIFMLAVCATFYISYVRLPSGDPIKEYTKKYLSLFFVIIVIHVCILLEDSFVISQQITFSTSGIIFKERNFTENLYWCLVAAYTLWSALPHLNKMIHVDDFEEKQFRDIEQIAQDYRFTPRETEIVVLLLKHYDNSKIAETLFITPGTLKAHIHNIYAKAHVTNRNEFIKEVTE